MRFHLFEQFQKRYSSIYEKKITPAEQAANVIKIQKLSKQVVSNLDKIAQLKAEFDVAAAPYQGRITKQMNQIMEFFEQMDILSVAIGTITATLKTGRMSQAKPAYKSVVEYLTKLHPEIEQEAKDAIALFTVPEPKPNQVSVQDTTNGRKTEIDEPDSNFSTRRAKELSSKHVREGVFSDFVDKIVNVFDALAKKLSAFVKRNRSNIEGLANIAEELSAEDQEI